MEARGILKLLNVRDNESKVVVDLSVHYFAQSVGIAIFFTICSSQFISHYDIALLPYLFIGAGVLQLLITRIYAHFSYHANLNKMMPRVVFCLILFAFTAFVLSFFIQFSLSLIPI